MIKKIPVISFVAFLFIYSKSLTALTFLTTAIVYAAYASAYAGWRQYSSKDSYTNRGLAEVRNVYDAARMKLEIYSKGSDGDYTTVTDIQTTSEMEHMAYHKKNGLIFIKLKDGEVRVDYSKSPVQGPGVLLENKHCVSFENITVVGSEIKNK